MMSTVWSGTVSMSVVEATIILFCTFHSYLLDEKWSHMLHSKSFNYISKKGGARPMAMNFATIFTNSHSIQKGAVGFIPCRSALAYR